ncbi:hypothetical protein ACFLZ1_04335 [Patescibacteria group bacterium]
MAPLWPTETVLKAKKAQIFQEEPISYTLEPSESFVEMLVSEPNESYGINVLLKDQDGNLLLDQSDVYYIWNIVNPAIATVYDTGFETDCPYGIIAPCSNLHADLIAHVPGETTIIIGAYLSPSNQEIASTTIGLKVLSRIVEIDYKLRFKGISKRPVDTADQKIYITLSNFSNPDVPSHCQEYTYGEAMVRVQDNGEYQSTMYLDACYLDNPGYRLCLKGPKHLNKCFDNLTFSRDQNLDLTYKELEPGDLSLPQNGVVDQADFDYLWQHRGSTNVADNNIGDLNLDRSINMGDIGLLLQTLGTKYDD